MLGYEKSMQVLIPDEWIRLVDSCNAVVYQPYFVMCQDLGLDTPGAYFEKNLIVESGSMYEGKQRKLFPRTRNLNH